MKHLKMSFCLLLMVAIFTSCEKETITLPENSEMNVQETEPTGQPVPISFSEIIKSGVDLETYYKSWPIPEDTGARPTYSQIQNTNLQFFYTTDDLPCNNLPTEDFENANNDNYYSFPNYLNENSSNSVFSPGDILPGISFVLTRNSYYAGPEYDYYDWYINNYGFYIWTDSYYGMQKALVSNYHLTDLNINFSANNVNQISMDLLNWYYSNFIIYVYGANDNLLGADVIWGNYNYYYYTKTFWGVKSTTPISKIVIKSGYYGGNQVIVDNVSFGNCDDIDGDGVLNENDAHPNSDMSSKINIGGCYPNVDNKMVKNGSTMMDQINDLVAQINSQYNGQNYTYLHKKFTNELSQITYRWRMARLITATQRSKISSCAYGANIPNQNVW
ncbi:MAG: hypothetical protein Q7U59_03690 [Lutibacter sp.]|nr:hypothetical protein [Lutibacter sp.]